MKSRNLREGYFIGVHKGAVVRSSKQMKKCKPHFLHAAYMYKFKSLKRLAYAAPANKEV